MREYDGGRERERVPRIKPPVIKAPVTAPKAPVSNPIITPIKSPVQVIFKPLTTSPKGEGRNLPESGFAGKYGTGYTGEGGSSGWKGSTTKRISFGPGNGSEGYDVSGAISNIIKKSQTIKNATLSNKKYNVGTSTTADPVVNSTLNPILYGGGGGGVMVTPEKPSFLSSIPSIVWIILAAGGAWYVLKSSGKR